MGIQSFDQYQPTTAWFFGANPGVTTVENAVTTRLAPLRIECLWAISTDTVDHDIMFFLQGQQSWSVHVPAGAGFGDIQVVDCFGPLKLLTGFTALVVPAADNLQFQVDAAVSDGTYITFSMLAGYMPAIGGLVN